MPTSIIIAAAGAAVTTGLTGAVIGGITISAFTATVAGAMTAMVVSPIFERRPPPCR
jgi:hypothetical protein